MGLLNEYLDTSLIGCQPFFSIPFFQVHIYQNTPQALYLNQPASRGGAGETTMRNNRRRCIRPSARLGAVFAAVITAAAGILYAVPRPGAARPQPPSRTYVPGAYRHAVFRPVALFDAKIDGGYLRPHIANSIDKGVLDYLEKFEQHGYIENFRIVGKKLEKRHRGGPNNDEFVYKLVEAAGYYAPRSPKIARAFASVNADILSAQSDDGYLNTYYDNALVLKRTGRDNRFKANNRFEFYDFGHFTQGAIAWFRSTGDRAMLDAAIRFADLICGKFSAPKMLPYTRNRKNRPNLKYEHPNHEMAMVELYRVTGNKRYLEFAKHTLDQYGFWKFQETWGHAVQETLLLCGGTDVYMEYGRPEMLRQLTGMWHDVTDRKMYITGGVGSGGPGESYGRAYELPNARSYCETCAALSIVMWNHRMLLATGDAKYADCMERALYNATLVGISLTGTEYFYSNRMETKKGAARRPWLGCSCCPPNVHRLLGSLQQYVYTVDDSGVQVNVYNTSTLKTRTTGGQAVVLVQETDYPRSGRVKITVNSTGRFAISLRIPAWAKAKEVSASCGGRTVDGAGPGGYLKIDRQWKKGDAITLTIPMAVRLVEGNPKVPDQAGKVAILRGPLVYCAEGVDNANLDLFALSIPAGAKFTESPDKMLGGVVKLKGDAVDADKKRIKFTAIPYNVWANREQSPMRIWFPRSGTDMGHTK